mmetsp:Transcript_26322/g.70229  ORF Transcript_26322/g.70229 Transcript_26322/m.70229 type:complete len:231 (+) Transcript_26322:3235-3927(+)
MHFYGAKLLDDSVALVLFEDADMPHRVRNVRSALALAKVVVEVTRVGATVVVENVAPALHAAVLELADVHVCLGRHVGPIAGTHIASLGPDVGGPVAPVPHADPLLLIIVPLAFVLLTVYVGIAPKAASFASEPKALVRSAVSVCASTDAVPLAAYVLALVDFARRKRQLEVAVERCDIEVIGHDCTLVDLPVVRLPRANMSTHKRLGCHLAQIVKLVLVHIRTNVCVQV